MAVEGLSRAEIRAHIASNLLGVEYKQSEASANGTTSTLIDDTLRGGDDVFNGRWVIMTSGNNDGAERQIDDYTQSSNTLTLSPVLGSTTSDGDTYELLSEIYSAGMIHRAINQAINAIAGRFYKREESQALHADKVTARFDLPSEFDMVDRVEYRDRVQSIEVQSCDAVWGTIDGDVTATADDKDNKRGKSLKLEVAAGVSANDILAEDDIEEKDLSGMTHLEFWIKSTVALDAGDLTIILTDASLGTEVVSVPATALDTWTYSRVALSNPHDLQAVDNIKVRMVTDKGECVFWFDDIKAVNEDSAVWVTLPKHLWRLDKENQDLILSESGRIAAGYRLLKLSGGSNPAQMTADSDVATVPESYLIAKATALLLMGGSRPDDPDGRRSLASFWEGIALRERGKVPALTNARKL